MNINVMLVDENAILPSRANEFDAGADLFSPYTVTVPAHSFREIDLGFILAIPNGHVGLIYARSGLGSKYGVRPRNAVGVVDSAYRGSVRAFMENASDYPYTIHRGDRILQLIVQQVDLPTFTQVMELDDTERGEGGFGSTGR